ncbi:S8 family serine peptidase [uncultured Tessaracoccus sp.]|uniref:S8 family serine peptidase n=1 Tax=uncultured Tessaracoccus sp. TaxID=905023 RepID=UPI002607E47B|nr:S8 family serine peptidase [uncultured Tessaracoccus sp.]
MLKQQPTGKDVESRGIAAVDRVLARWEGKEGFSVKRKFGLLVRGFSATLPANQIAALALDPDVASVKPLKTFQPSMETAAELSHSVQARSDFDVDGRGLVVSIIDTGIDIHHQDMRLDDGVKGKLAVTKGFTEKVPYGWNFADENNEVLDTAGSEHGMHVAGIVAANGGADRDVIKNGRISGIAPNAQLLAMKVFSNDATRPSAYEDDVIAAIESSVKHGADIINMSLGSPNGTGQASVGEARAIANAQAAGVQVIVAAGNEGLNGSPDGTLTDAMGMFDNGTHGSPASAPEALSIASINNTQSIGSQAEAVQGSTVEKFGYQLQTGTADGKEHVLVDGGVGKSDEIPAEAKGNYVLIQRGEIAFSEKFNNAIAKGATGVIIFNNAAGGDKFQGMAGIDDITIPGAFLYQSTGEKLKQMIAAGETKLKLTDGRIALPVADELAPSSFTSWGTGPELNFKPQLAGIGGSVYSTVNDNKYKDNSGTSMAAPHVAGVFALGREAYAKRFPELSDRERNTLLRTSFSNTAQVLEKDGVPYAPRQMGAGLVDTKAALESSVFATVDGVPNVPLRELRGAKTFTVTLENKGDKAYSFTTGGTCVLGETRDPNGNATQCSKGETLTASASSVTVPAKGQATVDFTITPAGAADHWVEGWAQLTSSDAKQPSLSVPYIGFAGDWNKEPIVQDPTAAEPSVLDQLFGDKNPHSSHIQSNYLKFGAVPTEWISPNGDGVFDEALPAPMFLRSASSVQYQLVRDGKVIRELGEEHGVQRRTLSRIAQSALSAASPSFGHKWDGTLYNSQTDRFEPVQDGKYTLRIRARLSDQFDWQVTDLPLGVDTVAPKVESKSYVKNNDGSITYTLKISDQGAGFSKNPVIAYDGPSGKDYPDPVFDAATGVATITIPADLTGAGHYASFQVFDEAGNSTLEFDFLDNATAKILDSYRFNGSVNEKSVDPITGQPLIRDGKVTIDVLVSEHAAKATVNGVEVQVQNGRGRVTMPVKPGRNEYKLVAYDKDGKELASDSVFLVFDTKAPVLDITDAPLNNAGQLVPAQDGSITIKGKVSDDLASVRAGDLYLAMGKKVMKVNDDGTFEITFKPEKNQAVVTLKATDGVNITTKTFVIAGAKVPGEALRIVFDDPRLNTSSEVDPFGKFAYFVEPSFHNLTVRDDGADLLLKGMFTGKPGKFIVDGKEIPVGDDLRFEVPLKLVNGINSFGYEVFDAQGHSVKMSGWRFFYDRNMPGHELVTTPKIAPDGAIYLGGPKGDIDVQGSVWDDEFGYVMAINGNVVKEFENVWDPGANVNRRDFETKVNGEHGHTMRISLSDQMSNGFERGIPLVFDDNAPTVGFKGVSNGDFITSKHRFTVLASDTNLHTLQVLVDGEEYGARVVEAKPHPGAYIVDFKNGEPQLDANQQAAATTSTGSAQAANAKSKTQSSAPSANTPDATASGGRTPVELTIEVNGLPAGEHLLEAVATDMAGNTAAESVSFTVDDAAPVIAGPDKLSVNPDKDIMEQLLAAYTVTDDADPKPTLAADVSGLVLGAPVKVELVATDASGKMSKRTVEITLERPMTTLKGECGSMTARFEQGDRVEITCKKQSDGSTFVKVRNAGQTVDGIVTVNVTGGPVYWLDTKGNIISRIASTPGKGTLTFQSASKANYRIGELPARGDQPIEGHKPGEPIDKPGLPKTGN